MSTTGGITEVANGMGKETEMDNSVGNDTKRVQPKRITKMTERGIQYKRDTLKGQMKSIHKRLVSQMTLIDKFLLSDNIDIINTESSNLDRQHTELSDVNARLMAFLEEIEEPENSDSEEIVAQTIWIDSIDSEYFACKSKICTWLLTQEKNKINIEDGVDGRSVASRSSRASSRRSKHSSCSSRSSASLRQKAKIAGLKAEANAIKKTKEAELNAELLRMQQQIAKAEAMEEVYAREQGTHPSEVHKDTEHKLPEPHLVDVKQDILLDSGGSGEAIKELNAEKNDLKNVEEGASELHLAMLKMMRLQSAPTVDIDVFSGSPLEYSYFKASFKDVVESTVLDQRGRLTRLIKYTDGEAKDLIKHLVHADSHAYDKAMALLDKEYGNPHLLTCSYLKELRQWPAVKQNDTTSYKKLYRFLLKCQIYKKEGRLQELDSTDTIRTLIMKTPSSHQERWNRKASDIRRNRNKEADFDDFVSFMEREVSLLCDPAYSRDSLLEASNRVKTFSTKVEKERSVMFSKCQLCEELHDLEDCEKYLSKDTDERHKVIFSQRLCFGCLKPIDEQHSAKTCTMKRKCKVCSATHPTTLHGSKKVGVQHSIASENLISMCVVPVELWHKDEIGRKKTVYALLDDCSQATFIREDVLDELEVGKKRLTSINIKTLNGEVEDQTYAVDGLVVSCASTHRSYYPSVELKLPCTYSQISLAIDKEEIPTPMKIRHWDHLQQLIEKFPDYQEDIPIALMIGANCPKALEPLEVISSVNSGPYAKRTVLGWCIVGPIEQDVKQAAVKANVTKVKIPVSDVSTGNIGQHYFTMKNSFQETSVTNILKEMYLNDFNEVNSEKKATSVEDDAFLQMMKQRVSKNNGHYELPLPFRNENTVLPNNRVQAKQRLSSIKRKLLKDKKLCDEYVQSMESLISSGYARRADKSMDKDGKVWYIPHHSVFHAAKEKIRVVFDCSATFGGRCLNEELIQGPDLTNSLVGVLIRFRKGDVAFMADIEAMFHQVRVVEEHRSFLHFLWWADGELDHEPAEYEMCVHLFGGISSPSCANFALRQTAIDSKDEFGEEASITLQRDFYVDDLLKSCENVEDAVRLVSSVRGLCKTGGFNLNKFISNSREVSDSVPLEKRASSIRDLDVSNNLPIERALGVFWCVASDTFNFRIILEDRPLTRRGILGTISSIYDPLGLASPFLLKGRKILQEITLDNSSWDDDITAELKAAWERWRTDLSNLENLKIERCYKPKNFKVVSSTLHNFSDASDYGYGQASYLRQVNNEGDVSVSLVMGKSRVAPSKPTTVPRLELTAALVSTKVGAMLKEELGIENLEDTYWVDSMVVLGYIRNDSKRFRTYVANRTKKIRSYTRKDQWKYVQTDINPADDASRGISLEDAEKAKRWLHGPSFLWNAGDVSESNCHFAEVQDDDPEVQKPVTKVNLSKVEEKVSLLDRLEDRISDWMRMKRVLATMLRFIQRCNRKESRIVECPLSVAEVQQAEWNILKMTQSKYFVNDLSLLKSGKGLKSGPLSELDPHIDSDGILRVGGRLVKSNYEEGVKHPIILPKGSIVVRRIIEWLHRNVQHLGITTTMSRLINCNAQVRKVIHNCVPCRSYRGRMCEQKMADLPENRTLEVAPFTYCGVDLFGPFHVKQCRREEKRYGIIFTCFSCRAIHLETVVNMDTDSFLLSLRRFIARRGPVRSIRSDNGGNFVGADNELQKAFKEMDHDRIQNTLIEHSCDWIAWERNPPISSHKGGVWERQIRSARNILMNLLKVHANRLNDESLRTLMAEVEAIVNSRPLTVENLSDPLKPLTPNHLLTMKSKVVLPPPGVFQRSDVYCRKRWRAVQYLANEFWEHWRKEFLNSLQTRHKWKESVRNIKVDDIILLKEQNIPRNQWPLGRITATFPGEDGLVRTVNVKVANSKSPLLRSVSKLVLLIENDDK